MTALLKPSRLARDVAKWEQRIKKAGVRAERAWAKCVKQARNGNRNPALRRDWYRVSGSVRKRDGSACRVCQRTVINGAYGGDPRLFGHVHHIVYRSQQGSDELGNLILVCGECHDKEHRHVIAITGTSDDLKVERIR